MSGKRNEFPPACPKANLRADGGIRIDVGNNSGTNIPVWWCPFSALLFGGWSAWGFPPSGCITAGECIACLDQLFAAFSVGYSPSSLGLARMGAIIPPRLLLLLAWPSPMLQWEIQKLTFLKKGPAQIKHADDVSRPVRGLTGRCADGKSRLPNSSAVILPEQCCREVQEL